MLEGLHPSTQFLGCLGFFRLHACSSLLPLYKGVTLRARSSMSESADAMSGTDGSATLLEGADGLHEGTNDLTDVIFEWTWVSLSVILALVACVINITIGQVSLLKIFAEPAAAESGPAAAKPDADGDTSPHQKDYCL